MHYAIGDVHGYYKDLMILLEKIEKQDPDARFILLGDIIDRGPDTLKVLEWAMNHVKPGSKYQCLRGNHEDLALQWYHHRFLTWEKKNKNLPAAMQEPLPRSKFDFYSIVDAAGLKRSEYLEPSMTFLDSLPYHLELETTVYCSDAAERGLSNQSLNGIITYKLGFVCMFYIDKTSISLSYKHLNRKHQCKCIKCRLTS